MIATLGSHKILDNETTVSNQHNNKSNKEGNNIITYDNLLNNYNIVGGHIGLIIAIIMMFIFYIIFYIILLTRAKRQ